MGASNFAMPAGDTTTVPSLVFLNGMPGSGKSAVGRALARLLGHAFVDLDDEVERLAGRAIPNLFEEGEAAFRIMEARALSQACERPGAVVAAGGGALASELALAVARAAGPVIYLRVSLAEIAERLSGRRDRPMLLGASGRPLPREGLRRRLEALLDERESVYLRSDHVVDVAGRSAEEVAREIAALLSRA